MKNENLTENKPKKKINKWYIRTIALVLAIIMVVSIAMNRSSGLDVSAMKAAHFSEEGENVVMDNSSLQEKLEALEEVKAFQKKLNDEYQGLMELIENGKYEEAIEPTKDLMNYLKDDEDVCAYLRATLAELYYTTGNYVACAQTCEHIVRQGDDVDGTYQFMAGICYAQTGEPQKCIDALEAAMEAGYPDEGICKSQIALAAVNIGEYQNAMESAKAALAAEHDESLDEVLHYIVAVSLLQTGKYDDAVEELNTLLKYGKDNAEYLYYRGVAYMTLEKYDKAAVDFKKSIDHGNKEIGCLYNYGICAVMSEDYENGVVALEDVIKRNENKDFTKGAQDLLDQINAAIEEAAAIEENASIEENTAMDPGPEAEI